MSKPRLFIGSSVEGLSVAYAIQENLKFTCESTVWDQGVFNLSEMSVESLLDHLDNADFGVFVFTPDDHIKIRGKKHLTVRDNVLFELGLFIGRLGKQRCFIIIPDNKDFHLPTDLIGVTPAKYEATRTDGNLQAGSGSASHKIREVIAKLGSAAKSKIEPEKPQAANEATDKNKEQDWFNLLFIEKDYDQAIASLKKKIRYEKESDEKVHLKSNICYAEFQKDAHRGKLEYEKLISENSSNNICYLAYANILFWNNSISKAIEIIET
ncbi:MAG: nucleotide-binding protein [Cyclobacteriaceae bacterium]